MGTPVVLSDGEFATDVLASDKPVLVDFWAPWCGPCKMIAPVLEEVAVEYEQQLVIGKLDVDQNQQTAQAHSVFSIPTLILFKDGQPVERIVGFKPKEALMAAITPHLG